MDNITLFCACLQSVYH